jgi:hypothetical protein
MEQYEDEGHTTDRASIATRRRGTTPVRARPTSGLGCYAEFMSTRWAFLDLLEEIMSAKEEVERDRQL